MKKVAIIEDHPMVTTGLKSIVQKVWRDAAISIFDTIEDLENHHQSDNGFELIIADIHLGEMNILERLILLQIDLKPVQIVLYTSSQPWEIGVTKEQFPFFGYVLKSANLNMIVSCLEALETEEQFLQNDLIWKNPLISSNEQIIMTKREREILLFIKSGKTNKEIGDLLFLSELTIKSHRQNMMRKFESKNVAELIAKTAHMF
jgi:DNA-binding NarL/FixJ family response regulator